MAGQVPGGDGNVSERIGELLRTYGLRRTVPRIAVLVAIEPIHGHLSVADIHQRLMKTAADDAQAPDLATVYRTVTTLVEHGVLHALTLENGIATYGLAKDPHHHAICSRCGDIIEIPASRLARALRSAREASSFKLSDEAGLTLHGLCPQCQNTP